MFKDARGEEISAGDMLQRTSSLERGLHTASVVRSKTPESLYLILDGEAVELKQLDLSSWVVVARKV